MSGWLIRKNTKVFSADSSGFLQFAMMMTAKKIQASPVSPTRRNEVSLKIGKSKNSTVRTAAPTANRRTAGQVIGSPP